MTTGEKDIDEAVSESARAYHDDGGVVVVHWALVADIMLPDGERTLYRTWSDGTTGWEMRGLFHEAVRTGVWESEESE